MHTEIVKVLLELELEGPLSAGAQHTNAWLGQEQLRAAAQDQYWVASSLDGWDHGVYKVHTHGARRGCREAVAWAGCRLPCHCCCQSWRKHRAAKCQKKLCPAGPLECRKGSRLSGSLKTHTQYTRNQEGKSLLPAAPSPEPSTYRRQRT